MKVFVIALAFPSDGYLDAALSRVERLADAASYPTRAAAEVRAADLRTHYEILAARRSADDVLELLP